MKITERGWVGHFICGDRCQFRRNTLIELDDEKVVVSTVGLMRTDHKVERIGCDRYYETMAFKAKFEDPYWEADVSEQLSFDSEWSLDEREHETDLKANLMHDAVVKEFQDRLTRREVLK